MNITARLALGSKLQYQLRSNSVYVLAGIVLFGTLAMWEASVRLLEIGSFVMPAPSDVVVSFIRIVKSGELFAAAKITLIEVLVGFGIAAVVGLTLGGLVGLIPFAERFLMPYVVAGQCIPTITIAPLTLLWFGFGVESKIATAAMAAWFPIFIGTLNGFRVQSPAEQEMLTSFYGSAWQIFRMLRIPRALPYIFTGLDVGFVFAILGAIVGEFIGGSAGLGVRILEASTFYDIPSMFAYLLTLSLIGLTGHGVINGIQRRLLFW